MEIREADIRLIVERVLDSLGKDASQKEVTSARGEGIFSTVEEAVKAAQKAQKLLMGLPLDQRRNLIRNIRKKALQEIETLSRMAVEETGMGRVEDKN